MLAAAVMFLLVPVLVLGAFVFGAWREGRNSPYSFGIGRVISNSFGAIGGAPVALIVASFTLIGSTTLVPHFLNGAAENRWIGMVSIGTLYLLIYPLVTLFMTVIAIDVLAGRAINLRDALTVAAKRYFPGMILFVLIAIGLIAGFLMLVIPGIVLLLTWFVVWPVLASEGRGVFDCFARSGALMSGMRWRLLLLLVIAFVFYTLFAGMGKALILALGGEDGSLTAAIIEAVTGTLTGLIQTTGAAAVYHEARTAKEGMGSHDLEAVFA